MRNVKVGRNYFLGRTAQRGWSRQVNRMWKRMRALCAWGLTNVLECHGHEVRCISKFCCSNEEPRNLSGFQPLALHEDTGTFPLYKTGHDESPVHLWPPTAQGRWVNAHSWSHGYLCAIHFPRDFVDHLDHLDL